MPIYDYRCDHCGHAFSAVQSFKDEALEHCPSCGKRPRRLISMPAIVFKGSGWYKTDSRASSTDAKADAKSEGKSETKTETKTETKAGTKTETKGETKSEPKTTPKGPDSPGSSAPAAKSGGGEATSSKGAAAS